MIPHEGPEHPKKVAAPPPSVAAASFAPCGSTWKLGLKACGFKGLRIRGLGFKGLGGLRIKGLGFKGLRI